MAQHERPSLAHLADKFNTDAPAGYVAGRGRGVAGFSKPPPEPKARGKKRGEDDGAADAVGTDEGISGEAADTRELDLGETEKYEQAEMSMGQQEAGVAMEPFNMKQEREDGHFDDDFNYVWRDTKDDEAHDAWLGEVDEGAESDAKVERRKALLAQQMAAMQEQEEAPADVPALANEAARLLEQGESVAAALRRYSAARARVGGGGAKARVGGGALAGRKRKAAEAAAATSAAAASAQGLEVRERAKKAFETLTDVADRLLRAGHFNIFSETREKLLELGWSQDGAGAGAGAGGGAGEAGGHLEASGFALDQESGYYYNSQSGMCLDARSGLYWVAGNDGPYYCWDAQGQQFVEYSVGEATGASGAQGEEPAAEAISEGTMEAAVQE